MSVPVRYEKRLRGLSVIDNIFPTCDCGIVYVFMEDRLYNKDRSVSEKEGPYTFVSAAREIIQSDKK